MDEIKSTCSCYIPNYFTKVLNESVRKILTNPAVYYLALSLKSEESLQKIIESRSASESFFTQACWAEWPPSVLDFLVFPCITLTKI